MNIEIKTKIVVIKHTKKVKKKARTNMKIEMK